MAIVSIFSGAYCQGDEIAQRVADELGYPRRGQDLLITAAKKCGCSVQRVRKSLIAPSPFMNRLTHNREKAVAYVRLALAEMLAEDNQLYFGLAGHLIPGEITHVLHICLVAETGWRKKKLIEIEAMDEKRAAYEVARTDKERWEWTDFIARRRPYDKALYDMVIPMHRLTADDVVKKIIRYASSEPLKITEESTQARSDFLLAAQIQLALVKKGYDVNVDAHKGHVSLKINNFVINMKRYRRRIEKIAGRFDGVTEITSGTGPFFRVPTVNPLANLQARERAGAVTEDYKFNLFISDRLLVGDFKSKTPQDDKDALACLSDHSADVVILDLTRPGISGLKVLGQIKHEYPEIEVIVLTGKPTEREETIATELGAFAYLVKPVDNGLLTRAMISAYRKFCEKNRET